MVSAVTPPTTGHPPGRGQWRVTRRSAYARIQSRGARVHTPHFVIVVLPRSAHDSRDTADVVATRRLGITVTKKVARRAVDRNRVKRLVREVFRRRLDCFPDGCDVVFLAKAQAWELGYADVALEVERARRALAAAAHKSRARIEADR